MRPGIVFIIFDTFLGQFNRFFSCNVFDQLFRQSRLGAAIAANQQSPALWDTDKSNVLYTGFSTLVWAAAYTNFKFAGQFQTMILLIEF